MTPRFHFVLCGLLAAAAAPLLSQQKEWKDPSPHVVKLVEVDTNVRLEVLAKRYRVTGVTRRGYPSSSAPGTGYGVARLTDDVLRIIDAVGLKITVVAGHSFAGEEMHVLGARHPNRIAGLVYIDAAFGTGMPAEVHFDRRHRPHPRRHWRAW